MLGLHVAHMKLLALLCSLVLVIDANAAEALRTIPNAFQGVWATSERHCSPGGESRLVISETGIDFYESRGRILGIAAAEETQLALIYEASGEGQVWLEARQFEISENGQTLTEVTGRRRGLVRHRCEVSEPIDP
jgi:hypothetical protein